MSRITFQHNGKTSWFNPDVAQERITESTAWDGDNWRGTVAGLQTNRATLYLTKGGKWIQYVDATREYGGNRSYTCLTDTQARSWLLKSASEHRGGDEAEQALAKYFPETAADDEDETDDPASRGGRPSIGPTINVAYPRDLLEQIDTAADTEGVTRASWLRKVAEDAVSR